MIVFSDCFSFLNEIGSYIIWWGEGVGNLRRRGVRDGCPEGWESLCARGVVPVQGAVPKSHRLGHLHNRYSVRRVWKVQEQGAGMVRFIEPSSWLADGCLALFFPWQREKRVFWALTVSWEPCPYDLNLTSQRPHHPVWWLMTAGVRASVCFVGT